MSCPQPYSELLLYVCIYISLVYGVLFIWKLRDGPIPSLWCCVCLYIRCLFIYLLLVILKEVSILKQILLLTSPLLLLSLVLYLPVSYICNLQVFKILHMRDYYSLDKYDGRVAKCPSPDRLI
jgi:hypothetical protein